MNKQKFVFIQNTEIPGIRAHSNYVVNVCNATVKLGLKTFLVIPDRLFKEFKLNINIGEYYGIDSSKFICKKINVPIFSWFKQLFIKLNFYQHNLFTLLFAISSFFYVKKEKIDIVQTSDPEVILVFSLLQFIYRPKLIYDVHIHPPIWLFWFKFKIDQIIVNCSYFKNLFIRYKYPENQILLIPNGFDKKAYSKLYDVIKIRKKYSIDSNRFIIGYIGRFETMGVEKGIKDLIFTLKNLKNQIPITIVAIGGSKNLISKYSKISKKLGYKKKEVFLSTAVAPNKVPEYISIFDVGWLVYPDTDHFRYKMSPMKAIEYMASGKPIIASNFESLRELLPQFCTKFVDPKNREMIINAVIYWYNNKVKFSEKIKNYVKKYSWEERQLKILNNLI